MKKLLASGIILALLAGLSTVCMAGDPNTSTPNSVKIFINEPEIRHFEVLDLGVGYEELWQGQHDLFDAANHERWSYQGTVEPSFGESGNLESIYLSPIDPDTYYAIELSRDTHTYDWDGTRVTTTGEGWINNPSIGSYSFYSQTSEAQLSCGCCTIV